MQEIKWWTTAGPLRQPALWVHVWMTDPHIKNKQNYKQTNIMDRLQRCSQEKTKQAHLSAQSAFLDYIIFKINPILCFLVTFQQVKLTSRQLLATSLHILQFCGHRLKNVISSSPKYYTTCTVYDPTTWFFY